MEVEAVHGERIEWTEIQCMEEEGGQDERRYSIELVWS